MAGAAGKAGRTAAMLVVAGMALSACAQSVPPVIAVATPPGAVPPPLPQAKPPPPAPATAVATLTPPMPPARDAFADLHGLDQDETVALLGEPAQRTEAPPAIMWRYQSRHCQLDVYFYLDLESREMRVLHYEVRDEHAGAEPAQRQCYRELVTDRRGDPAGRADRAR
jgi:hypothetical protein